MATRFSSQPETWEVLDRLRANSGHPNQDLAVSMAALIYLRWADFQEAEQEAMAAFDETEYRAVLHSSLHWRTWQSFPADELRRILSERLAHNLEGLNNSRHSPLATHLHRLAPAVKDLRKLPPQVLFGMTRWLADQPFETPRDRRILLDRFDGVLNATKGPQFGEFRTPDTVVRLLVALADPSPGERLYDPCFGFAGLLTASSEYVVGKCGEGLKRNGHPPLDIFGIEINPTAYLIGLVRLALIGIDDPQLELGNALERAFSNQPQTNGFDIAIADPPWGIRVDPAGLDHFPVRSSDATSLFIQHILSHLRPNGRAVIVVPQGFLFRGGPEQRLRRLLLEQHTVEAVISLPPGIFLPYTGIKAGVLVLRRGGPTKSIRMVDAEPFFSKGKAPRPETISQERLDDLIKQVQSPNPGNHGWDIDPESLTEVDWDFTPKQREQSSLTGLLVELGANIEFHPLKECCDISIGRTFNREQLLDSPLFRGRVPEQQRLFSEPDRSKQLSLLDAPVIPFLRIKDVQRGQVNSGSSWLSPDAAASADSRWKLKAGDLLLSKSGTIGKVGVVRNGGVGAIAASGLFVLRPDQDRLDPHFLLAYLNSKDVKAWMDDRARGGTIRHLSIRSLEDLPVPIPPFQIQQRVGIAFRENGVDAVVFLTQLLTKGERDPIDEWVYKANNNFNVDMETADDPLDLTLLDRLAVEVREIRNMVAHQRYGESILASWLLAFGQALAGLRGLNNFPAGPGLLSVLQESARNLNDSVSLIKGHLPNESAARDLTKGVVTWINRGCAALIERVELIIDPQPTVFPAGEKVRLDLTVENRGPLPLRDLNVTSNPNWGVGGTPYLAEKSKTIVGLSGIAPKKSGSLSLEISWAAKTINGVPVAGVREIALDFITKPTDKDQTETEVGASPYVCGDPVSPKRNDVFFGRDELLEQIRRQITRSGNVVLLEGNRRSGKSSVLFHLVGTGAIPGWLGVYCSLQDMEGSREGVGVPTVEVFRGMARSIANGLQSLGDKTPLPDRSVLPLGKKLGIAKACRLGISEVSPFSDFRDYLEVALETLEEHNLSLLLMLDEFDKLQEGIESGVTSPQVPENIRVLLQTFPIFSAILTGSRRMKRLREAHWSVLYGLGTRFGVTSLPAEHARRLVTEPVKGRLTYSKEAVERVVFLTSGQPYLLQCLCNRIFDMAAQLKKQSVTLDLVDQAGNALVQDNEHFASLWDYAGSDRRRFLLVLCHKESESPDPLRLKVIQERLLENGIDITDETLIKDLDYLRELELIELVSGAGGGHYVLTIPLMGNWIEKQHDFSAIKRKAKEDQNE